MSRTIDRLDSFYAESLGCSAIDLNANRLIVVENDLRSIWYAKGTPLALYALAPPNGGVIAVRPQFESAVRTAVGKATRLDDSICAAIERAVDPLVDVRFWFHGVRLFCEPEWFLDREAGDVREVLPAEDERTRQLNRKWGGKVFGLIADDQVVSWAAVKPLSEVVWDLSIETLTDYRGRGYAESTVSAALKHIFANGRLAGWGSDPTGTASLRTAHAVGFRPYALDFGCVMRSLDTGL
jgi:hypothetical protein